MKKVVICALIAISSIAHTQETKNFDKRTAFGFYGGVNYSNVLYKNDYNQDLEVKNGIGGTLGLLMDYELTDQFIISPAASLSFNTGKINVYDFEGINFTQEVMPISIDLASNFKFQFGSGKAKPYLLTGPYVSIPVKKDPNNSNVFPSRTNVGVNAGFGMNISNEVFDIAPELRYSFGLLDVNTNPAIGSVKLHSISLLVHFKD